MGRGSSKANGGAGGGTMVVTQITDDDGSVIDLASMPLTYGPKDAALTGNARKSIEAFEDRRYTFKSEYGYAVDAQGNLIGREVHGGRSSVRMPYSIMSQAETFSHNHPRGKGEKGVLGGTFSGADLKTFEYHKNIKTIRATGKEGTYSMTKGNNFDGKGFVSMVNSVERKHLGKVKAQNKALYSDAINNRITHREYYARCNANFNNALINIHNDLLANQKQYGYTYTLERR